MIEEITEEAVSTGNGNISAMENCVTTPEVSSVRDKKIGCSVTSCIHLFQKYNLQLFKNKKMQSSVTYKKNVSISNYFAGNICTQQHTARQEDFRCGRWMGV